MRQKHPKMMRQCRKTGEWDILEYYDCYCLLIPWWSEIEIKHRASIGEELWSPRYFFYPVTNRVFEDTDIERMREEGYSETIND